MCPFLEDYKQGLCFHLTHYLNDSLDETTKGKWWFTEVQQVQVTQNPSNF